MTARLLVDVDALAKLSHWNLATELPAVFGIKPQLIYTLPSMGPRASRALTKPDGKLFRNRAAPNHLIPLLNQFGSLPAADPDHLAALQDNPQIDGGEAVLFAVAMGDANAAVLTGDKRAVKALHSLSPSTAALLTGKVICLEHVVQFLLKRSGLEWLRQRVCPEKDIDKAIGIIMGSRCDAGVASVEEGLTAYICDLNNTPCFSKTLAPR